ncbi:MAG: pantetheine-phosphate adenylyltransferase [Nitrososphaerales archaeon]
MKFRVVAVGGTFDYIHKGHRELLAKAFECGEKVIIGVTTDNFVLKVGKSTHNRYEDRVRKLKEYLLSQYSIERFEIHPLDDYFGSGIYREEVEALVASVETASRVELANKKRVEMGLKPLKVIKVNMVLAEDGKPISSSRIRSGSIDTEGRVKKKVE